MAFDLSQALVNSVRNGNVQKPLNNNGVDNIQNSLMGNTWNSSTPAPTATYTTPTNNNTFVTNAAMSNIQSGGNVSAYKPPSTPQATPITPVVTNPTVTPRIETPEEKAYKAQIEKQNTEIAQYKTDSQNQQTQTQASFDAAREAKLAAVRAAINASKSKFNDVISNAPQQFQAQRNESAAQGDINNLQLRRSLGNMGYAPNEDLAVIQQGNNTNAMHGQLNQLDIAEKKTIQDAQAAIANLEAQGQTEEASTIYDYATKSLDSINNQKNQLQSNLTAMNQNYTNDLQGLMNYISGRQDKADEATRLAEQLGLQKRTTLGDMTGIDPITGLTTASQSNADRLFKAQQNEAIGKNAYGDTTLQAKTTNANLGTQALQDTLLNKNIDKASLELANLPAQIEQQNTAADNANIGAGISNKINQLKLDNLPQEVKDSLALAQQQLEKGKLEIAMDTINKSYLDSENKAKIAGLWANVNQSNASATASLMNAETNKQTNNQIKKDTLEAKQLNDATTKLDSLFVAKQIDPTTGNEVPKIIGDPQKIRQAILGLNLGDDITTALLSRYDVMNIVNPNGLNQIPYTIRGLISSPNLN
jgi:hypothetical protein